MKVIARNGKNGKMIARVDGALMIFDRKAPQPKDGEAVDVMICGWPGYRDHNDVAFLIVRPVTADDLLVAHRGFECEGSMCCTTASIDKITAVHITRAAGRAPSYLTPGRTPVVETDNVNIGWHGQTYQEPTPGAAYVSITDMRDGHKRICGVPDLSQVRPDVLNVLVGYRAQKAAA